MYAVKYPEQEQMEVSDVNYIPNREILGMLGIENTKGVVRAALESRLEQIGYE